MPAVIKQSDIVIIGSGMVGLTAALALAKNGLKVIVAEVIPIEKTIAKDFDGRVSAITLTSARILESIGAWEKMAQNAEPITHIRISDGDSKLFLDYDSAAIENQPMGYIIENRFTRESLLEAAKAQPLIEIISPLQYGKIDYQPSFVEVHAEGLILKCKLLIAADGKKSRVAKDSGIESVTWNYSQDGIVCTVEHEKHHNNAACERFLTAGPFAILPMKGGYKSSLVWTEDKKLTQYFKEMPLEDLTREVEKRFGEYLGKIKVLEPRFSFPLSLYHAKTYIKHRMALVGDAAHSIHPVAGQGLNLGIRDAAVLAESILEYRQLGLDIGSSFALKKYENLRRNDNLLMMSVTDGLNHLFSNDIAPLKLARDIGMSAVDKINPLKKFFMLHAIGATGHQPEMAKNKKSA